MVLKTNYTLDGKAEKLKTEMDEFNEKFIRGNMNTQDAVTQFIGKHENEELNFDISNAALGWMTTYTGTKFNPLKPTPEMIEIRDIAHALSLVCRWGGHTTEFYSVAQHCVCVSEICLPQDAKKGLLHDATEAYIGDMIRPLKYLKQMYKVYKTIEGRIDNAIAVKVGLDSLDKPESVQWADTVMLAAEAINLRKPVPQWAYDSLQGLGNPNIKFDFPWRPEFAETQFINRFNLLFETNY